MQPTTIEFLTKLADLLEEYGVELTIEESCNGYAGFTADGIGFDIPWVTEDGYKRNDYVSLNGKYFNSEDVREKLNGKD